MMNPTRPGSIIPQDFLKNLPPPTRVPTAQVDAENRATDFSLGPIPQALRESIQALGVVSPLLLTESDNKGYQITSGHRRLALARELGLEQVPALITPALSSAEKIALNLAENRAHRQYSDVEKGLILYKLQSSGAPDNQILVQYMPWIDLQSSKKLCEDFIRIQTLSLGLQKFLHVGGAPIRKFLTLLQWDDASRAAMEGLAVTVQPGANKLYDLLERIDEIARRENYAPRDLIEREEVQTILAEADLSTGEKYQRVYDYFHALRYPTLAGLQKRLATIQDQLALHRNTRIKTSESFENREIKIELKFTDQKDLVEQAERLRRASESAAMADLVKLFRDPE